MEGLKKHTILLIDDDPEDIELFHIALAQLPFQLNFYAFDTCAAALNAYDAETKTPPDYIFLDFKMPVIDGLKCLELLNSHPTLKDIPVIIYAHALDQFTKMKFKALLTVKFFLKPLQMSQLSSFIDKLFPRQ